MFILNHNHSFDSTFSFEKVSLNNQGGNAARFFLCSYCIIATALTRLFSKEKVSLNNQGRNASRFFLCSY